MAAAPEKKPLDESEVDRFLRLSQKKYFSTRILAKATYIPDMMLGDIDAPITIYVYNSIFGCGYCWGFHLNEWKLIKKEYVDTGKVRLVFRELPLDDRSLGAFMLARCASDDIPKKYFQIIDEFFKSTKKGCSNDCILEIIKRSGMSNKQINFCLKNKELMRNIRKNIDITYNNFGVSGAPTIFINGRKVEGRYKIDKYRRIIEDELERAKSEEN